MNRMFKQPSSRIVSPRDILPSFFEEYYYHAAILGGTNLTGGSGTNFQNTTIRVETKADFKCYRMTAVATSPNVLVRIRDGSSGRYIVPNATDLNAICGFPFGSPGPGTAISWFTPYVLPTPYTFRAGSEIIIEAADYSTATNTVRFVMHGVNVWEGKAPWENQPKIEAITYTTGRKSVAANGTLEFPLPTGSDADFLIQKITAVRTGAAIVNITEDTRSRTWGNTSTHIDNLTGNGQFPHRLPAPRMLKRNSTLQFNVTDLSGSTNVIEFVVAGVKFHAKK